MNVGYLLFESFTPSHIVLSPTWWYLGKILLAAGVEGSSEIISAFGIRLLQWTDCLIHKCMGTRNLKLWKWKALKELCAPLIQAYVFRLKYIESMDWLGLMVLAQQLYMMQLLVCIWCTLQVSRYYLYSCGIRFYVYLVQVFNHSSFALQSCFKLGSSESFPVSMFTCFSYPVPFIEKGENFLVQLQPRNPFP